MHRGLVPDGLDQLLAARRDLLARGRDRLAAAVGGAVLGVLERGAQAFAQHGERGARVAGDQQIGLHLAERKAARQRITRDVDDLGVASRPMGAWNPRHDALEHDHHVGLGQERGRLEAHMHGMGAGQIEVARLALHHRQRELLRQRRERVDGGRIASDAGGDDQREFGLGDEARSLLDRGPGRLRGERAEPERTVSRRGATALSVSTSRGSVR